MTGPLWCTWFLQEKNNIMHNNFWVFLDILNICVCVFLWFATLTQMFLITRRHARQNAALVSQLNFNHRIQHGRVFKPQEAAATKMVGVVVAVFLSCYSLFVLHHVLNMAGLYGTLAAQIAQFWSKSSGIRIVHERKVTQVIVLLLKTGLVHCKP